MKIAYERRKALAGVLFSLPFIVGFALLYLWPIIQSLLYSVNDLTVTTDKFDWNFIGLENYKKAFVTDSEFVRTFLETLKDLLIKIPTILVYSLFIALILNRKFKGRMVVRSIFFLPVIIASGVVIDILNGDVMSKLLMSGERSTAMFQVSALTEMMRSMGLSDDITTVISNFTNSIFELSWKSGIQILLFIAGLQTVPDQLYEAADVDGCTAWERFWKITFPLMSPMLIINLIYTVTDHFTSYQNGVMRLILNYGTSFQYSYSATLAWIYFAVILVILGVIYGVVNRRVVYY